MISDTLKVALEECTESTCIECSMFDRCREARNKCSMSIYAYIHELLGDDES